MSLTRRGFFGRVLALGSVGAAAVALRGRKPPSTQNWTAASINSPFFGVRMPTPYNIDRERFESAFYPQVMPYLQAQGLTNREIRAFMRVAYEEARLPNGRGLVYRSPSYDTVANSRNVSRNARRES